MKFMHWQATSVVRIFRFRWNACTTDGNAAAAHWFIRHTKTGRIDGAVSERQSIHTLHNY